MVITESESLYFPVKVALIIPLRFLPSPPKQLVVPKSIETVIGKAKVSTVTVAQPKFKLVARNPLSFSITSVSKLETSLKAISAKAKSCAAFVSRSSSRTDLRQEELNRARTRAKAKSGFMKFMV